MSRRQPITPDQLVVRVARQDREAFAALYDALAPLVHGIVLTLVPRPSLAEQASCQVFVEVWRRAGTFDPSVQDARTWVAVLAHRHAVDLARHERRAGRAPAHDDRERDPVLLAYASGLTYREVAHRLGLDAGVVASRMRSGLELLARGPGHGTVSVGRT